MWTKGITYFIYFFIVFLFYMIPRIITATLVIQFSLAAQILSTSDNHFSNQEHSNKTCPLKTLLMHTRHWM